MKRTLTTLNGSNSNTIAGLYDKYNFDDEMLGDCGCITQAKLLVTALILYIEKYYDEEKRNVHSLSKLISKINIEQEYPEGGIIPDTIFYKLENNEENKFILKYYSAFRRSYLIRQLDAVSALALYYLDMDYREIMLKKDYEKRMAASNGQV